MGGCNVVATSMAGIVCLVCRNCEQAGSVWYIGSLSYVVKFYC